MNVVDGIREALKDLIIKLQDERSAALEDCLAEDFDYEENRGKSIGLEMAIFELKNIVKKIK